MLENALTLRNMSFGVKITYKTLISAGLVCLAVILPQIVHLALGTTGGVKWLPMYFPILIGGCLLGPKWGLAVGVLSPMVSFIFTSALGNPMPMASRLPYMIAELAIFAIVSGLFTRNIAKNGFWAFPAVILAQVTGRTVFIGMIALTQNMTQFTVPMIWTQILTGFYGLAVEVIIVPALLIGLRSLLIREKDND